MSVIGITCDIPLLHWAVVSLVLFTLLNPAIAIVKPLTVSVNVGDAKGVFKSTAKWCCSWCGFP